MDVLVNAAMSADGKLSTVRREQVAISGPDDFARVDRLRAGSDAVAVGVGTVLADDPRLTVKDAALVERRREGGEPAQPMRVVADSRARTPPDARVLDDDAPTYLLVSEAADPDRLGALRRPGVEVAAVGEERVALERALVALADAGVASLLVEGGGELVFSFLEAGLVDRLSTFVGPQVIGGRDAPTLADGDGFLERFPALELVDVDRLDGGVVLHWRVDDGPEGGHRPAKEG